VLRLRLHLLLLLLLLLLRTIRTRESDMLESRKCLQVLRERARTRGVSCDRDGVPGSISGVCAREQLQHNEAE